MKLHIFNPEHDMALAAGTSQFTAPHAGRHLRADLGFIPALWAADGDMVLVDDVQAALHSVRHLSRYAADVLFVTPDDVRAMFMSRRPNFHVEIQPWGWDLALCRQLMSIGLAGELPSGEQLNAIRTVSSRQWAAVNVLPKLKSQLQFPTVGEAWFIRSPEAQESRNQNDTLDNRAQQSAPCRQHATLNTQQGIGLDSFTSGPLESLNHNFSLPFVLKAPWSCSGRGVRYVHDAVRLERYMPWARRVVSCQGGIMLEPLYDKVRDFAMEFDALPDGRVVYRGLSLFATHNGAYTGNVIATEATKRDSLARLVPAVCLDILQQLVCEIMPPALQGVYTGPFGIDMMVVAMGDGSLAIHPCVELNLRRTMGHVALSLPCDATMPQRIMRISYTDKYRLQVLNTNENVINNSLIY